LATEIYGELYASKVISGHRQGRENGKKELLLVVDNVGGKRMNGERIMRTQRALVQVVCGNALVKPLSFLKETNKITNITG
jgi:hypothetical protein